jgi:dihydropteroate synthase
MTVARSPAAAQSPAARSPAAVSPAVAVRAARQAPDGRESPIPARTPRHVLFVTGRLAEPALRATLAAMAPSFVYTVAPLKITVAALMTTPWIARFLELPAPHSLSDEPPASTHAPPNLPKAAHVAPAITAANATGASLAVGATDTTRHGAVDTVMIPGLCEGDLAVLADRFGPSVHVVRGPKDLREIPEYFGRVARVADYGAWDIRIVAEINNAPKLSRAQIAGAADYYRRAGADVIDIGCTPGLHFPDLGPVVRELVDRGIDVSIDSFDPAEIRTAVDAGARLVFSVNSTNIDVAGELAGTGTRVVVIPDFGGSIDSIDPSVAALERWGVPYYIDPVIEPIGFGFAASLERFWLTHRRYPVAELLMGVGNITELTAADTTGVHAILLAICQEVGVRAVLTTEVTPWAHGAVREIDIARRLMHYAVSHGQLPKHIDDRLLTIKDPAILDYSEAELRAFQSSLTDANFRIFVDRQAITVLNCERFVRGTDIGDITRQLGVTDVGHAFYLGQELARAKLALLLGKTYRQEGSLRWGYLTPPDEPHAKHLRVTSRRKSSTRTSAARDADISTAIDRKTNPARTVGSQNVRSDDPSDDPSATGSPSTKAS